MDDVRPIDNKIDNILVKTLHYRFIPMMFPEKYYHGDDMMGIAASPHVELLRIFIAKGKDWSNFKNTPYVAERRQRRQIYKQLKWTDEYIYEHVLRRIAIYHSLKKLGFDRKLCREKPVMVLQEPFWKTRFEYEKPLPGPEIWDGGGRCAAAFVLGWDTIPGLWVKDVAPGTKSCPSIERKFQC